MSLAVSPLLNIILVLVLCCTSTATVTVTATAKNNLVEQTCARIYNKSDPPKLYEYCVKAFESIPESRKAENLTALGLISIQIIQNYSSGVVLPLIKHIFKDPKLGRDTRVPLSDCLELYTDMDDSTFNQIEAYYKSKDYASASVNIDSLSADADTCEIGFGELKVVSPLTKQNDDMSQFTSISLAIINLLSPK